MIRKIVHFSGIRTWIVRVEGKHANHLTKPPPNFDYCYP